jgi:uncharacterized protein DUF4388
MSIDKTREEILRLIARVNRAQRAGTAAGERTGALPRGPRAQSAAAAPATRQVPVLERRRTLETVRQQRVRQEATRAAQGIIDRLAQVEDRLALLEARLEDVPTATTVVARPAPGLPDCTLGGRLRDGLLTDLLQLVGTNLMTGDFCIRSDSAEYHLFFEEGEIRHGIGPGCAGEEAVFGALAVQEGQYSFRETSELPAERTIQAKTQFLILEALRQIDERSGGA